MVLPIFILEFPWILQVKATFSLYSCISIDCFAPANLSPHLIIIIILFARLTLLCVVSSPLFTCFPDFFGGPIFAYGRFPGFVTRLFSRGVNEWINLNLIFRLVPRKHARINEKWPFKTFGLVGPRSLVGFEFKVFEFWISIEHALAAHEHYGSYYGFTTRYKGW